MASDGAGATDRRVTLVAIMTVRREAIEKFRAFERHAAAAMRKHGGRIERTVLAPVEDAPELVKEIHVVTFPSASAFAAYRGDEELRKHAPLRDASVVRTELLAGEDGPDYGAG